MELVLILFVALGVVGVSTLPDAGKKNQVITNRETRLIEQSRETVYDTKVIKEWGEQ